MYYFDQYHNCVWNDKPEEHPDDYSLESFTPTIDVESGFLLWFDYSTYDSFGSNPGLQKDVVDLYETYEDAKAMAEFVREYDSTYNSVKQAEIASKFFWANKKADRPVYLNLGWGTELQTIYVDQVEVLDPKGNKKLRQRTF